MSVRSRSVSARVVGGTTVLVALLAAAGLLAATCPGPGSVVADTKAPRGGLAPFGITRVARSMAGYASAVEWDGDYIYLAASTVLQVYFAPRDEPPKLVHEIEVRDWIPEMEVVDETLFVAARGDGLLVFDISNDPAHPRLTDRVSGIVTVPGHGEIEAVFHGLHAVPGRVAVAHVNNVNRSVGGVDALVYDVDTETGRLSLAAVVPTDVRAVETVETATTVALTSDGTGLYVGYGVLPGELAFVRLDGPELSVIHADIGSPFDIETRGDTAFVALTRLCGRAQTCNMLSRLEVGESGLAETPLLTNKGAAAGGAVDIDGERLCFGTWSPARYGQDGDSNIWVLSATSRDEPEVLASAGTMDWVFSLACRQGSRESDEVMVADEWGGLEVWRRDEGRLRLDLARDRMPTGALSDSVWVGDGGSRVYSVKNGAGLWAFDPARPSEPWPAVEWIHRSDPGCACEGCCPPQVGSRPFPPAVFVAAGASTQGRVALLAADRNSAVPGSSYLMLFEEEESQAPLGERDGAQADQGHGRRLTCVQSLPTGAWSGRHLEARGELLLATTAQHSLQVYQHCPQRRDAMQLVGALQMPSQDAGMGITDLEIHDDVLFVAETHSPVLSGPDRGAVHAFRWRASTVGACPALPPPLKAEYLGAFATDVIPIALSVDAGGQHLFVGTGAKDTFPPRDGAVLRYDLSGFDPADPTAFDTHRVDVTPPEELRTVRANVVALLASGNDLLVVDRDNGLYRLDLRSGTYTGFYPAHRGPESEVMVARLVQAPDGVIPLYHPVSVARLPNGLVVVQEHNSGRVALLTLASDANEVLLPHVRR